VTIYGTRGLSAMISNCACQAVFNRPGSNLRR
jgi:hypothetical protein